MANGHRFPFEWIQKTIPPESSSETQNDGR
jgi:hypothetical protein